VFCVSDNDVLWTFCYFRNEWQHSVEFINLVSDLCVSFPPHLSSLYVASSVTRQACSLSSFQLFPACLRPCAVLHLAKRKLVCPQVNKLAFIYHFNKLAFIYRLFCCCCCFFSMVLHTELAFSSAFSCHHYDILIDDYLSNKT